MLDFHEKRRLKSYLFSKYVAGGLFLLAALLSVSVYGRFEAERRMAARREELADELHSLKERAAAIETEVARLKSERGIEEEIRDRYQVSRAGEKVVVILGEEDGAQAEPATSSEGKTEVPVSHKKWWKWW